MKREGHEKRSHISLKRSLYVYLFCLLSIPMYADKEIDALARELDYLINNKHIFNEKKEKAINDLKRLLNITTSPEQQYEINQRLYGEYKSYMPDSAIYYVQKNLQIAESLGKDSLVYRSEMQLSFLYSSIGMYRESENLLEHIEVDLLPKNLRSDYYETYCLFFKHYNGGINYDSFFPFWENEIYRDSLLSTLDTFSYKYKINLATKHIKFGLIEPAKEILLQLLQTKSPDTPEYAMITSLLGFVYRNEGIPELEKKFYILSAIADLKNSIKENASMLQVALLYYKEGDIAKAFRYTQAAMEDAVFCKVQFRTAQSSKYYPIINASYQAIEAKAKSRLLFNITLMSILTVFLILFIIRIKKQMKNISVIKEELSDTNSKLYLLNDKLNKNKDQLLKSNYIKEQYIVQIFDLCSAYIDRMEEYRKTLYKSANNNKLDELLRKLRYTTTLDNETEFYKYFDNIFLGIYPTFVAEFNALLVPMEQIILKTDNQLNTELRIYALLRLGITDNTKIAAFLRCSMSTVYNYRTKMRNRAIVSRDEFENIVMSIGKMHRVN
ncbi:MAG: DUF6377 domain-containing protein [Tannerellaceae bacterium]|nr:DUF6377 domain-containing protein [Tannerellaceae bacterium]